MFEAEKDERIRGLDETTMAVSMAYAHDFILEVLLTRHMIDVDATDAEILARVLVERWQRRYGGGLADDAGRSPETIRRLYATKAFVDRLARKALRRSIDVRDASAAGQSRVTPRIEVSAAMRQAGAEILMASAGLAPDDLATEIYRAMAEKA